MNQESPMPDFKFVYLLDLNKSETERGPDAESTCKELSNIWNT